MSGDPRLDALERRVEANSERIRELQIENAERRETVKNISDDVRDLVQGVGELNKKLVLASLTFAGAMVTFAFTMLAAFR